MKQPDRKALGRILFTCALFACVVFVVFQSWSSTSSLGLTLSSTWRSVTQDGDDLFVQCSEDTNDRWRCDCTVQFRGTTRTAAIHAYPLFGGGWYWVDSGSAPFFSLYMEKGRLTLQRQNTQGEVESFTFTRSDTILDASTATVLKKKSKYLVALVALVGSYRLAFGKQRVTREARLAELRRRQAEKLRAARKNQ